MMVPIPPIFAVGYLAPLIWGLGLGSIPVVIHLLQKRKYREADWAAMRFLMEAIRKNSRRIRLEQWLLLAVRVLLMLLAVAALQSSFDQGLATLVRQTPLVHKIVVVDASFSMGVQIDNETRFEKAKELARQVVTESHRGDALNLVRIADSLPRVIVRQPAYNKSEILTEIEQLQLSNERGNVATTLAELNDLLDQVPDVLSKEVIFVSDFQSSDWTPSSATQLAEIQLSLRVLSEKARLVVIDLGKPTPTNAAVVEVNSQEPFAIAGRSVGMTALLRAFGAEKLRNQAVQLYVDGRMVDSRTVALQPGSETPVSFQHTFNESGEHDLEVRLANDVLEVDNHRWLALPVKDQLQVLLVNGVPDGDLTKTATHHLKLALAPGTYGTTGSHVIRPDVINWGELVHTDLTRYDCVFLCNVEFFTEREAGILETYARNGGGVIFTLGDRVQIDNYNQLLFRDGDGLLAARLLNPVGNPSERSTTYQFDVADLDHPIVSPFRGNPGTGLEATMTFAYIKTELGQQANESVVLPFNSGDAAIIDRQIDRGRSILITTAVDESWGTWSVWAPSFVPLMNESVYHAVAGRWKERQLTVGQPLSRTLPTRVLVQQAKLKLPQGDDIALPASGDGEFAEVLYSKTAQQGIYRLALGPPISRTENYAVNIDPRESDLQFLGEQDIRGQLANGLDITYLKNWEPQRRQTDVSVIRSGGLARWFLVALLGLLFVEQMMAWNFRFGVGLLCALVTVLGLQSLFSLSGSASLLLSAIILAGVITVAILESSGRWRWSGRRNSP